MGHIFPRDAVTKWESNPRTRVLNPDGSHRVPSKNKCERLAPSVQGQVHQDTRGRALQPAFVHRPLVSRPACGAERGPWQVERSGAHPLPRELLPFILQASRLSRGLDELIPAGRSRQCLAKATCSESGTPPRHHHRQHHRHQADYSPTVKQSSVTFPGVRTFCRCKGNACGTRKGPDKEEMKSLNSAPQRHIYFPAGSDGN